VELPNAAEILPTVALQESRTGNAVENRCQMSDHCYIQALPLEGHTIDTILPILYLLKQVKEEHQNLKLELPQVGGMLYYLLCISMVAPPTSGNIMHGRKRVRFMLSLSSSSKFISDKPSRANRIQQQTDT